MPKKELTELEALTAQIDKTMGEGVITKASKVPGFIHIPTGCFLLDYAMVGGYAEGCGHMVYGVEGCSKTTLCMIASARLQDKYPTGHVGWVDTEKKFDTLWAAKLGMDLDRTIVVKPRTGEHAVDIMEALARTEQIKGLVLDSIPSLAPMSVIQKSAEDPTVAARARLVGLLCSKLQQAWIDEAMRGHKFTFWAINQFREKIGCVAPETVVRWKRLDEDD
jgi:recombination protein RecA